MPSRKGDGWGGIVPSEDLTNDSERTDPNIEMPMIVGSEEKTTVAHMPPFGPKKGAKPKLTLPRPQSDPNPAPSPPPALEFAVEVDQIVQKLEPPKPSEAKKKKKAEENRLFTKEVILTIAGGLLLLGGAFAYSRSDDEVQESLQPPPPLQPVVPPTPKPVPKPEPKVEKPEEKKQPQKASTPILSILSIPSGARVEIDGTIYGSTPLIQPSPAGVKSMSIRLLKDNYKSYEVILTPNEAGHFNLNATLQKR